MRIWLLAVLILLALVPVTVSAGWIIYDNGQPWGQVFAIAQDDGFGVMFNPGATGDITKVKAYLGRHNGVWDGFNVRLYGWDNTFQQPNDTAVHFWGEIIGTEDYAGWVIYDVDDYNWGSTDPFVISLANKFGEPDVDTIYTDSDTNGETGVYFRFTNGTWSPLYTGSDDVHNLMVRVEYSGVPVESTSFGSIKAVFK